MKYLIILYCLIFLSCSNQNKEKYPREKILLNDCVSMKEGLDKRMQWFDEARLGMFIYWGDYSPVNNKNENGEYYKDKHERYNPVKFNAEEWARIAKDAGIGYIVFSAKQYDGLSMYNSRVNDYNIVRTESLKFNPMKDMEAACRKVGLRFGIYYSLNFGAFQEDISGKSQDGKKQKDFTPQTSKLVDNELIPQLLEIINIYQPDLLWLDIPEEFPQKEKLHIITTVRQAAPDIILNENAICECSDYVNIEDYSLVSFEQEGYWETVLKTKSFFENNESKSISNSTSHLIHLLAKTSAKGGNILLNIEPRTDGSPDSRDVLLLKEIAKWWKINGESSIKGTQKTYLNTQTWGESTLKNNTLYLHIFDIPTNGELLVEGLSTDVERAYFLHNRLNSLKNRKTGKNLVIEIPKSKIPPSTNLVIALECIDDSTIVE